MVSILTLLSKMIDYFMMNNKLNYIAEFGL